MNNYGLHSEFNIAKHKYTFANYLEILVEADGHILYAVPSHQELAIHLACKKKRWTREELNNACPPEFYFDFLKWVLSLIDCISVWNNFYIGEPNEKQIETLKTLKREGLYKGEILYG